MPLRKQCLYINFEIMDSTTPAIPLTLPYMGYGYGYGNWGYGNGYNNNNCIQSQINQLADQVSANDIKDAVRSVGNDVTNWTSSIKECIGWVNQNVTAGNYTTLTGLNDLGRDINHSIQREEIAWMNAINNSNISNLTWFNNTNAVIATWFNQSFLQNKDIISEVFKWFGDTKLEMAKQHCDIKELVREENGKTRELINNNTMLDLQRQLNDVKAENSNYRQTRDLLSTLVDCRPKPPCPCPCPSSSNGNGNWNS